MTRVGLVGGGELGIQIAHIISSIPSLGVSCVFDDHANKNMWNVNCYELSSVRNAYKEGLYDGLVMAIGYTRFDLRKGLFEDFKNIIPFINVISPHAFVDKSAVLSQGIVIYPMATIDKEVIIEDNVLINIGASVSHNSKIGHSTYISPQAAIAGFVNIGECCFVGINSTFVDNVTICDKTKIAAGSVIIKDIQEQGTYAGVPARKIH